MTMMAMLIRILKVIGLMVVLLITGQAASLRWDVASLSQDLGRRGKRLQVWIRQSWVKSHNQPAPAGGRIKPLARRSRAWGHRRKNQKSLRSWRQNYPHS